MKIQDIEEVPPHVRKQFEDERIQNEEKQKQLEIVRNQTIITVTHLYVLLLISIRLQLLMTWMHITPWDSVWLTLTGSNSLGNELTDIEASRDIRTPKTAPVSIYPKNLRSTKYPRVAQFPNLRFLFSWKSLLFSKLSKNSFPFLHKSKSSKKFHWKFHSQRYWKWMPEQITTRFTLRYFYQYNLGQHIY